MEDLTRGISELSLHVKQKQKPLIQVGEDYESDDEFTIITCRWDNKWMKLRLKKETKDGQERMKMDVSEEKS
jgi:hypothetical protein